MDKLQAMRVFRRVAEMGGFALAARDLGLSAAAVSKHVGQLEAALGARLLHRTTRRIGLTEIGQAYLERARRILDEIAEAEDAVAGLHDAPRGLIRVNAPMSFGLLHAVAAVERFMDMHPGIEVDLSLNDRVVDLVEEGVDLALRVRRQLDDSTLVARRLSTIRHVVCAAPAYLAEQGVPAHPADLAGHDCLVYTLSRTPNRWAFSIDGRMEEIVVSGRLRANSSIAIRDALLAGHGIALIPTFAVADDIAAGRLTPVLADFLPPPFSLYAVHPPGRRVSAKVRLLADHLRDAFGDPPYWDFRIPS